MELAFKTIIEGLGVGGALFVLACLVIVYMYRQNGELHTKIDTISEAYLKAREALQEKRLEEAKQLLVLVERNNTNSGEVSKTIASLTTSLNDLIRGFAAMAEVGQVSREILKDQGDRIEQGIRELSAVKTQARKAS